MTVSREECICTHNFACDFCKMFIICLFLAVLSIHCCLGFSLVAANRSYSLAVVYGLLIAVISLVEHQLWGVQASVVVMLVLVAWQYVGSFQVRD